MVVSGGEGGIRGEDGSQMIGHNPHSFVIFVIITNFYNTGQYVVRKRSRGRKY